MKKYALVILVFVLGGNLSKYDNLKLNFDKALKLLPELEQFVIIKLGNEKEMDQIYIYDDSSSSLKRYWYAQIEKETDIELDAYLKLRNRMRSLGLDGFRKSKDFRFFIIEAGHAFAESDMGFMWSKTGKTLRKKWPILRIDKVQENWYKCIVDN